MPFSQNAFPPSSFRFSQFPLPTTPPTDIVYRRGALYSIRYESCHDMKSPTIKAGYVYSSMQVIETMPHDGSRSNRRVLVECTLCHTKRPVWSSAIASGRANCLACKARFTAQNGGLELAKKTPFAIMEGDKFRILWGSQDSGETLKLVYGDALWIAINNKTFVPWTPTALSTPEVILDSPVPTPEHHEHAIVPAHLLPYLVSEGDGFPDEAEAWAQKNYPDVLDFYKGRTSPWNVEGSSYNYIYFAPIVYETAVIKGPTPTTEEIMAIHAKKVADMEREQTRLREEAESEEADRMRRIALAQGELSDLLHPKPKPKPLAKPLDSPGKAPDSVPTIQPLSNLLGEL